MPFVVYNLDDAIDSFFSSSSSTRRECDDFVLQRYGVQGLPVDIQGISSYTVIAGPNKDKIIQFRDRSALLEMDKVKLAKDIHSEIVPNCSHLGWIGDSGGSSLAVYEMDRLHGDNYIMVRPSLTHGQRLKTMSSLARFFAQSWQKNDMTDQMPINGRSDCSGIFQHLSATLPDRFLPAIKEVQTALPDLVDGSYPWVLTHSDLNEMNILVDSSNGKITGVIDWADASVLPFGFSLYALENALGCMNAKGWQWFDDVDELREAFWKDFQEESGALQSQIRLIKVAAKAGILVRYGTAYDSGFSGMAGVRDPQSEDFRFLDALL